jgi:hypothetical protein
LSRRDPPKEGEASTMLHHSAADGGWDLAKLGTTFRKDIVGGGLFRPNKSTVITHHGMEEASTPMATTPDVKCVHQLHANHLHITPCYPYKWML